jgi:hypothetical protein
VVDLILGEMSVARSDPPRDVVFHIIEIPLASKMIPSVLLFRVQNDAAVRTGRESAQYSISDAPGPAGSSNASRALRRLFYDFTREKAACMRFSPSVLYDYPWETVGTFQVSSALPGHTKFMRLVFRRYLDAFIRRPPSSQSSRDAAHFDGV